MTIAPLAGATVPPAAVVASANGTRRPNLGNHPLVSVVMPTCGRGSLPLRTLRSLLNQSYSTYEIVVVDNRPGTSGTECLLTEHFPGNERLRYVAEPRQGVSWARNTGVREACGSLLMFTDDDVIIDRDWLAWMVSGFFMGDRVGCVTGLILPAELDTRAQRLFEEFGGYGKGSDPRIWDLADHRESSPLFPYRVGVYGSGANAAFSREAFEAVGGFDIHLGTGTVAKGGEDLDLFLRVLRSGHQIVYQPAAQVWHHHHSTMRGLKGQLHDYGIGLGALFTKLLVDDPGTRREVLSRVMPAITHLVSSSSPKNEKKSSTYPRRLTITEWSGLLAGPLAYLRCKLRAS